MQGTVHGHADRWQIVIGVERAFCLNPAMLPEPKQFTLLPNISQVVLAPKLQPGAINVTGCGCHYCQL